LLRTCARIAGIFRNHSIVDEVIEVYKDCGEKFWKLPLEEGYKSTWERDIADISNVGSQEPCLIASALFLNEFVGNTQ